MIEGMLVGSWKFFPKENHWVGVVANQVGATLTVVSVGVEYSERDVAAWVNATIALMRQQDNLEVQAPDAIERQAGTNMQAPPVH